MARRLPAAATALICLALCGCGGRDARWAGTWRTTYGRMVLRQDGDHVTGSYTFCEGTIDARADGTRLRGTWRQRLGCDGTDMPSGPFDFQLASSGGAFAGDWSYEGHEEGAAGRPWDGRLLDH